MHATFPIMSTGLKAEVGMGSASESLKDLDFESVYSPRLYQSAHLPAEHCDSNLYQYRVGTQLTEE